MRQTDNSDQPFPAILAYALLGQEGAFGNEIERIDALTPAFRNRIQNDLSRQERALVMTIAREMRPLRIRDIAEISRIKQQNHISAIVTRLVQKSFLEKSPDGYRISSIDPDFGLYLIAKFTGFPYWLRRFHHAGQAIPENAISLYLSEHTKAV